MKVGKDAAIGGSGGCCVAYGKATCRFVRLDICDCVGIPRAFICA